MKTINSWMDGKVIFEYESGYLKRDIELAVQRGTSLSGADLRSADLSVVQLGGADLTEAMLRRANLSDTNLLDADLSDADLSDADLRGTNMTGAKLRGTNLRGALMRGADLFGADLFSADLRNAELRNVDLRRAVLRDAFLTDADLRGSRCGVDLRGADLSGADIRGAALSESLKDIPTIERIHTAIADAVGENGENLMMGEWHCGTAHCRAGWAVTLAGGGGADLECSVGTSSAAALIYAASDPELAKIPDFYCTDKEALADIKRMASEESARGGNIT